MNVLLRVQSLSPSHSVTMGNTFGMRVSSSPNMRTPSHAGVNGNTLDLPGYTCTWLCETRQQVPAQSAQLQGPGRFLFLFGTVFDQLSLAGKDVSISADRQSPKFTKVTVMLGRSYEAPAPIRSSCPLRSQRSAKFWAYRSVARTLLDAR
ncbi:hypothetical protein OH77DRAFT_265623 [Trametes cingulata]|nr:hypothetical protein OH77DRAFT_265623 [Trametes cingulata]